LEVQEPVPQFEASRLIVPPFDPIVWLEGDTEQVVPEPVSQLMVTLLPDTLAEQLPLTVIVSPDEGAEATAPPMKAAAASRRPNVC
jgi:hypothetical protein